jgi:patched 1 protein/patched 2 protein
LVVVWYIVVFVYGYLAYLNHRNSIYSHSVVVVVSIAAISLATLSAIGLSAWMGLPATSLTNTVVPFIAMGIGIDDTFVVISAFMQCFDRGLDAESIVAKTTEAAGPMILYTTATNMVAYGIASALPVYIIQLFCYQMVLNIALNLIILMLLVIPFLRYDAQRILAGKSENCFPGDVNGDHKGKHEHWMNQLFERMYVDYLFTPRGKALSAIFFAVLWLGKG